MKKLSLFIIVLGIFIFLPSVVFGSLANDFQVHNQSTYSIPPGTTRVLILDLTLPEQLESIKIFNAGSAQQWDISKISVFEDGASAGWDGDENEIVNESSSPFWDTLISPISGDFSPSQKRIFITVDIASTAASERTIKPQLVAGVGEEAAVQFVSGNSGPTDENITGFERMILALASHPTVPVAPLARTPEALSTSSIRWYFTDLSNNEFGFKILDSNLREVVRKEEANLFYLDETGLEPGTNYSGRRAVAFNDIGESSASTIFPEVYTLAKEVASEEEVAEEAEEVEEEVEEEKEVVEEEEEEAEKPISEMTIAELKEKIAEIQRQVIELLGQLIQLLQQQIAAF